MSSKLSFEEGERVIYPNHGICVIEDIRKDTIGGISDTFYSVKVLETGSSLFIPSSNLETVGVRPPVDSKDVKKIFKLIDNGEIKIFTKWKNRYEENLRLLGTGTPDNMVEVLKSLYYVEAKKTLSFREKKMQEKVMSLLTSEIAHSLDDDRDDVSERLDAAFKKAVQQYIKNQE